MGLAERIPSNLAQTLAYRQADGDLERAVALYRSAHHHFTDSPLDMAQWGCHAANLASVAGDDALFADACAELFDDPDPSGIVGQLRRAAFPPDPNWRLFSFSVVTRATLVGRLAWAGPLRELLTDEQTWDRLYEGIRQAPASHPLELYTRHLVELAPPGREAQEQELLALSLRGFGNREPSRVVDVLAAGTQAFIAARRFAEDREEAARSAAEPILPTFLRAFEENPWVSPTTYHEDGGGWFNEAVAGLRAGVSLGSVAAFCERYRFEWR